METTSTILTKKNSTIMDMESDGAFTTATTTTTTSNTTKTTKKTRRKSNAKILVNTQECKYEVVRECCKIMGWEECGQFDENGKGVVPAEGEEPDYGDFNIMWKDTSVSAERVMKLKPYQRINHFPGMYHICRKVHLAKNLNRMKKLFKDDYNFFPQTWVLPFDYSEFCRTQCNDDMKLKKKMTTYIIKPNAGCQGRGIILTKDPNEVKKYEDSVVQKYIPKPLLIEGYKFDMRVYVLVLSCDPLRIFLYKEGLVRLCTEKYRKPNSKNLHCSYVHLTNYAINKHNPNFVANADAENGENGSKRNFAFFNRYLKEQGYDADELWARISSMVIKTLIAIQPQLQHIYRTCQRQANNVPVRDTIVNSVCFELLGFDVLIDSNLRPWVLEVNHSPSFNTDSPLDHTIKRALILEVMKLLNLSPLDKRKQSSKVRKHAQSRIYAQQQNADSATAAAKSTDNNNDDTEQPNPAGDEQEQVKTKDTRDKRTKWEDEHMENFVRIYPCLDANGEDPYARFYNQDTTSSSTTNSTTPSNNSSCSALVASNNKKKGISEVDLRIRDLDKIGNLTKEYSRSPSSVSHRGMPHFKTDSSNITSARAGASSGTKPSTHPQQNPKSNKSYRGATSTTSSTIAMLSARAEKHHQHQRQHHSAEQPSHHRHLPDGNIASGHSDYTKQQQHYDDYYDEEEEEDIETADGGRARSTTIEEEDSGSASSSFQRISRPPRREVVRYWEDGDWETVYSNDESGALRPNPSVFSAQPQPRRLTNTDSETSMGGGGALVTVTSSNSSSSEGTGSLPLTRSSSLGGGSSNSSSAINCNNNGDVDVHGAGHFNHRQMVLLSNSQKLKQQQQQQQQHGPSMFMVEGRKTLAVRVPVAISRRLPSSTFNNTTSLLLANAKKITPRVVAQVGSGTTVDNFGGSWSSGSSARRPPLLQPGTKPPLLPPKC